MVFTIKTFFNNEVNKITNIVNTVNVYCNFYKVLTLYAIYSKRKIEKNIYIILP